MKTCRVCGAGLGVPVYQEPSPGITSLATILDVPTTVYVCGTCDHAQASDLPDVQKFYDTEYRISAASDEHDQLYAVADGKPVFRTDRQAEIVLGLIEIPHGARILDFGAAKAATLRKIVARRPDIQAHVFDVSDSYADYWRAWLDPARCATHSLPPQWSGTFDAVTAHYVLEHVVDPVGLMTTIASLLKPGGRLFLSVPDPIENPGDLLVVDHLNHFTPASLVAALTRAGLTVERLDRSSMNGALVVVGVRAAGAVRPVDSASGRADVKRLAQFWRDAAQSLRRSADAAPRAPSAIYGAGFYGTWIASVIRERTNLVCFVDNNPHLLGALHLGLPVLAPADLPLKIEHLYAGLNPLRAREILANSTALNRRGIEIVYLDETRM